MAAAGNTKPPADRVKALARRIHSVDDHGPHAKILVYGQNGQGKTRFAASAPKCLIVDVREEGTRSAKGSGAKAIEVGTWQDVGDIYWYLQAGKHPYESVAIDTITALQELAMSFVLGEAEARDPTREKAMPDKRSYGRAGQLVKGMLLAYRNLPLNVVFTAQERRVIDQDTEELQEITVDLPNSSRGPAMGCVGILGRITSEKVRVRRDGKVVKKWVDQLQVGPHEVIKTKDRTNALGNLVRNPTMSLVLEAWNQE